MTADIATAILLLVGVAFLVLAGIAVLRMPDLFMRLSASSKAVSLGAGVMFIGVAVHFGDTGVSTRAVAGIGFFLLTSPVAAHILARAGHHTGIRYWQKTVNTPPRPRQTVPEATDQP